MSASAQLSAIAASLPEGMLVLTLFYHPLEQSLFVSLVSARADQTRVARVALSREHEQRLSNLLGWATELQASIQRRVVLHGSKACEQLDQSQAEFDELVADMALLLQPALDNMLLPASALQCV